MYTLFTYIFYFASLYVNFCYPLFTAYRVICTFSGICFCDHILCMYKREYEIINLRLVTYIWKLSSVSRFQHVTRPVGFSYSVSCGECVFCALTFGIAPAPSPLLLPHYRNHPAKQTLMHISNFQYFFSRGFSTAVWV